MPLISFFDKNNLKLTKTKTGNWINELIPDQSSNTLKYYASNHFLLTSGLIFATGHFARAKYKVVNKDTRKEVVNHKLTSLINNPNKFHTHIDLMQSIYLCRMIYGVAVLRRTGITGFRDEDLIVLNNSEIEFPENLTDLDWKKEARNLKIKYNDTETIPFDELIFFYDNPAGISDNETIEPISRLKSIMETLHNSYKTQIAKGIVISSNGKELISAKTGETATPFSKVEKQNVEQRLNNLYGLGRGRSRALVTASAIDHKSLHIPLRDLGLDDSVVSDAKIVFNTLNIPSNIYNLESKKSSYKNFDEEMVGYYQGNLQTVVDDICMSFNNTDLIEEENELVGNYNHLPVMASRNKKKFEVLFLQGKAISQFLDAGFSWEDSLEMCSIDDPKKYKREDLQEKPKD